MPDVDLSQWIDVVKQGGAFSAGAIIVALVYKWANSEASSERKRRLEIDLKREQSLLKQIAQQNDLVSKMNGEKQVLILANTQQKDQIENLRVHIEKLQGGKLL